MARNEKEPVLLAPASDLLLWCRAGEIRTPDLLTPRQVGPPGQRGKCPGQPVVGVRGCVRLCVPVPPENPPEECSCHASATTAPAPSTAGPTAPAPDGSERWSSMADADG